MISGKKSKHFNISRLKKIREHFSVVKFSFGLIVQMTLKVSATTR